MNLNIYEGAIEAVLFANGESVSLNKLAFCLEVDEKTVKSIIKRLMDKYEDNKSGIKIIEMDDSYQMCTNEYYFDYISRLVKAPAKKVLTQTLLETLAIIAYKQPITKTGIEEIRGVNADHAVNRLMEYELVCEKGRLDAPGRPILFGTTDEFLKYFGFSNLRDLPEMPNGFQNALAGE